MKHKADGLYYVTHDMLSASWACGEGLKTVRKSFKTRGKILVTKRNVARYLSSMDGFVVWPLRRMALSHLGYVPHEVAEDIYNVSSAYYSPIHSESREVRKLFVDVIAERFMNIVWEIHQRRLVNGGSHK